MAQQPKPVVPKIKPGDQLRKKQDKWDCEAFEELYPLLTAYLALEQYEDSTPRRTATLTVFCDTGCLTVILNDRDNNRSCFINAPTLEGCFEKIEQGLRNQELDWRIKQSYGASSTQTPF